MFHVLGKRKLWPILEIIIQHSCLKSRDTWMKEIGDYREYKKEKRRKYLGWQREKSIKKVEENKQKGTNNTISIP